MISAGSIKHVYTGNGVTRDWPYTFPIFSATGDDIELYKTAADGTITEITANYSVNVIGSYVTYPTIASGLPLLTASEKITLLRTEPLSQASDWVNQGPFNAETVETALDKVTAITQQQGEGLSRAVKFPVDQTPTADDTDTFLTLINTAKGEAQTAATAAQTAQTAAELAETNAELAETNAELAEVNAETAEANAETAEANAVIAKNAAQAAQTAAELAETNAETAETNAELAETNAETAEVNAELAETNAETAETNAGISATNASNSATAAASSATDAANYAAALKATSATSVAIGLGSKTFTTQSGKQFATGQFALVVDAGNNANYMHGQVTSYSGTTFVIDSQNIGGSGTIANWNIYVSGSRGAEGAAGASGLPVAAAGGTVDAITADYTPDITLTDLKMCAFTATGANTSTAPTFAPDGLTAHIITKKGGQPLVAGDIAGLGAVVIVEYNLANTRWELANPSSVVELAGDQTVAGIKTFSSIPVLPASDPTTDNQASRKAYTDGKISKTTAGEINVMTEKTSLADNDEFVIEDSAASYAKKKIKGSNVKGVSSTKVYDSGWFAITVNTAYSKTHSLGTTNVLIRVYLSANSDGSGQTTEGPAPYFGSGGDHGGTFITSITTTVVTLRTAANYIGLTKDSSGNNWYPASGYCRIIMLALG